jgi:hypothetical protein
MIAVPVRKLTKEMLKPRLTGNPEFESDVVPPLMFWPSFFYSGTTELITD